MTHTLAAEKAFCLSLLYLTASEYQRLKPFGNNLGATGRHILTEYPDIAAIADMPLDDLAALLHKRAHGRLTNPRENATKLHQVVQDSYPLAEELVPAVQIVLAQTLAHIDFLEKQKKTYLQHITTALDALPEAKPALAISGLGPTLVAGCLAEIQDTRRFITGRKFDRQKKRWRQRTYRDGQAAVAKLAGLWWPQNSSGRFVGKDRPLARERNPYLSYWFVQAAYSLKERQSDYAAYYNRKFRQVSKHRHRRALILTARKAVRLIFALLHKGQMAQLKEAATT